MSTERCIAQKLGTCRGCPILGLIAQEARFKQRSLESAAKKIAPTYCPTGERPDIHLVPNQWASFGMGQSRNETIDFPDEPISPDGKKLDRTWGMR